MFATVSASVRAAFIAGMTTITLPGGRSPFRSDTTGLHVDGAAAPDGDLDHRTERGERAEQHRGGDRERALAAPGIGSRRASGRRMASYRSGRPGSVPTIPCSQPNSTWPPRQ